MSDFMDDRQRAEAILNSQTRPKTLGFWNKLILFGLIVGITTLILRSSGAEASSQVLYSARFDWKGSSKEQTQQNRIILTQERETKRTQGTFTAQIWSGNICQATCRIKSLETQRNWKPTALHMECQSTQMETLRSSALLTWGRSPGEASTLQFGTWLQGYRKAILRAEKSLPALSRLGNRSLLVSND